MADRVMATPATSPQAAQAAATARAAETRAQAARPLSSLAPPLAKARSAPESGANASGFTDTKAALLEAARTGRSADIAQLLSQGAPINATDSLARTPLMLAVINGHEAAVKQLLVLGANRALTDGQGLTALDHARKLGLNAIATMIEAAH